MLVTHLYFRAQASKFPPLSTSLRNGTGHAPRKGGAGEPPPRMRRIGSLLGAQGFAAGSGVRFPSDACSKKGVIVSDLTAGFQTEKTLRQLVQLPLLCQAIIMTCQVIIIIIVSCSYSTLECNSPMMERSLSISQCQFR